MNAAKQMLMPQVEASAPLLKKQQEEARAALKDLVISAATYHELRQVRGSAAPALQQRHEPAALIISSTACRSAVRSL